MNNSVPVVMLDSASLSAGRLTDLFASGALAVVINYAVQLRLIWTGLLENKAEQLPWAGPIRDLARNHYAGANLGGHVGDMFHYTPYRIAYIARKFELTKDDASSHLASTPDCFYQGDEQFTSPAEVVQACWIVIEEIMKWLTPPGRTQANYQAVVHRLKYEADISLTKRHFSMTRSAIGRWAQLGYDIDMWREQAHGPLDHNGICDLFAILSLAPAMRRLLAPINKALANRDPRRALPDGAQLIGKPHYDGRYFSAMCGSRASISTEVYDGRYWHELPIDREHLVIIPGLQAKEAFNIKPTLHRVLHRPAYPPHTPDETFAPDITLLLGSK